MLCLVDAKKESLEFVRFVRFVCAKMDCPVWIFFIGPRVCNREKDFLFCTAKPDKIVKFYVNNPMRICLVKKDIGSRVGCSLNQIVAEFDHGKYTTPKTYFIESRNLRFSPQISAIPYDYTHFSRKILILSNYASPKRSK